MVLNRINMTDRIIRKINIHPEYSSEQKRIISNCLIEYAHVHSPHLEIHEELMGDFPETNEELVFIRDNLRNAWDYLENEGISLGTLAVLGNKIAPKRHPYANFRSGSGSEVTHTGFVAPESAQVPYLMKDFFDYLNVTRDHPILRSIEAHIELVRIHPYLDGNHRSARILQNFCLYSRGYPPLVITEDDRETYLTLLHDTLRDRYDLSSSLLFPSTSENNFREFMVGKIFESANSLDENLRSRRVYSVKVNSVDSKGLVNILARNIRGRIKSHNDSPKVDINNEGGKSYVLDIVGDISARELRRLVGTFSDKHNLDFEVVSVI